jgi:hypothetical protein
MQSATLGLLHSYMTGEAIVKNKPGVSAEPVLMPSACCRARKGGLAVTDGNHTIGLLRSGNSQQADNRETD